MDSDGRGAHRAPRRARSGSTKRPTFNGESTDRVAVETLYDSLAIAGDHKAHFDITVNGDFDQFDRNPIEIISPSVLCALHFFASGSYQRALATGHCVSQQALSEEDFRDEEAVQDVNKEIDLRG
ncbi:hypothetical protein EVAR_56174_1 [Eumeta japonica]|uniref:Uncharacterized protein n=1 Tax=Eumeta variegata TaxID=151549 RepID=A0A4C1ZUA1_EUMVA|nr:hypothetical protein EVAR_56174_1 [Eumeta japonica]